MSEIRCPVMLSMSDNLESEIWKSFCWFLLLMLSYCNVYSLTFHSQIGQRKHNTSWTSYSRRNNVSCSLLQGKSFFSMIFCIIFKHFYCEEKLSFYTFWSLHLFLCLLLTFLKSGLVFTKAEFSLKNFLF